MLLSTTQKERVKSALLSTVLSSIFEISHTASKDGIKPKLVSSIVFRDPEIWIRINGCVREEIERIKPEPKNLKSHVQLDFFKANEQKIA